MKPPRGRNDSAVFFTTKKRNKKMSRFIGKRVFYTCDNCNASFTTGRKSVDKSVERNRIFCSEKCWQEWERKDDEAALENAKIGNAMAAIAERLSNIPIV